MGYTLAVFGQASLNKNLIFDTLADHFRFGPPDGDGYYTSTDDTLYENVELIVAVETAEGAQALEAMNEWSARAGFDYALVTRSGLKAKALADDANRIVATEDVPAKIAAMLEEAREDGRGVGLALALEADTIDSSSVRLLELLEGRVAAYDIGNGLLPVEPLTLPAQAPAEPEERAVAAEPETVFDLTTLLAEIEKISADAVADALMHHGRLTELLDKLRPAGGESWEQVRSSFNLTEQDEAEIARKREELLALQAAHEQQAQPEPEQPEPVEEPKPRPTKVKREWLDPETNTWKPIGRGRPRKNVEIREVQA